jgi:hypothetical protein
MMAVLTGWDPAGVGVCKMPERQAEEPAPGAKHSERTVALFSHAAQFQPSGVLMITAAMAVIQ